jgi:2-polyprenyl-3-methyl-5-hydroxy-6-metoxy-1,4-benzoquinol methylase
MEIWEAIEQVSRYKDRHPVQTKYDLARDKIYQIVGLYTATLQPKTILDVGTAYGTLAYILTKAGMKVTATDIMDLHSKKMFKEMGIDFIKHNIETDKLEGEYDVCILTDVLEHLCYNPLPVLKKIAKVCKGIVISTPAKEMDYVCEGKWCDLTTWREIPQYKDYKFEDGHHHTYYLWELQELLEEAGFKITEQQLMPIEATWIIKAEK